MREFRASKEPFCVDMNQFPCWLSDMAMQGSGSASADGRKLRSTLMMAVLTPHYVIASSSLSIEESVNLALN